MNFIIGIFLEHIMQYLIELNVLYVKKMVLQIVLIIILEESELIHIILCLEKKH